MEQKPEASLDHRYLLPMHICTLVSLLQREEGQMTLMAPPREVWALFLNHLLPRRRVENVSRKIGVRKEALVLKVDIAWPF